MPIQDLTGQEFGRLRVRNLAGVGIHREAIWRCACKCGKVVLVSGNTLCTRSAVSCGCWKIERAIHRCSVRGIANPGYRHGHTANGSESRTYQSWSHMIERCSNPMHIAWKNYGGAGIQVCARWLRFMDFLVDMGERPLGTSLGRFRDLGNYEPGNCAWQTKSEQVREQQIKRFLRTVAWG